MHPKHPKQNRHWGWHIFQTKANCILRGSRCRTYPSSLPRTVWAGSVFKQGLHCVEMAKHAFSAWSLNVSHLVSTCVHTYICTYIYIVRILSSNIYMIYDIYIQNHINVSFMNSYCISLHMFFLAWHRPFSPASQESCEARMSVTQSSSSMVSTRFTSAPAWISSTSASLKPQVQQLVKHWNPTGLTRKSVFEKTPPKKSKNHRNKSST